ncbi:hypothetical protein [Labrenzia sp. CE80]|uniref:hypothetical protein n=1 Tax=Labrenzia sp. CE80 TaxID=1788986 RepID=UPI00129B604D|nr:hypothetical protein [Labrenzia sp. CE80]
MTDLKRPGIHLAAAILFALSGTVHAEGCANGPDAYQVSGVAENDVLNARSGPGLKFGIVGTLPPTATDLEMLDQVSIVCDDTSHLNAFERNNFWTKIYWSENGKTVLGWVKTSFLVEN